MWVWVDNVIVFKRLLEREGWGSRRKYGSLLWLVCRPKDQFRTKFTIRLLWFFSEAQSSWAPETNIATLRVLDGTFAGP